MRKKRLDSKLEQKEVANLLDVNECTIWNWENNRCQPGVQYYPAIMRFLGYCPLLRHSTCFADRLKQHRVHSGYSVKELAKAISVDPATLRKIERRKTSPTSQILLKIQTNFDL